MNFLPRVIMRHSVQRRHEYIPMGYAQLLLDVDIGVSTGRFFFMCSVPSSASCDMRAKEVEIKVEKVKEKYNKNEFY